MNYELWVMSYELWVMNYEGWVMRDECGVKSWSWNILLYEEILHCAVLRSEWQGYVFYSRLGIYIIGGFFLKRKDFFSWIAFLSKLSWRNSFVLKRCGEGWRMRGASISITKFTEMWWNDCVFESSEEHRKCSGKVTDIRLAGVEKLFPWWKDSSLRCA